MRQSKELGEHFIAGQKYTLHAWMWVLGELLQRDELHGVFHRFYVQMLMEGRIIHEL
jgi:hypothetical protein